MYEHGSATVVNYAVVEILFSTHLYHVPGEL